MASDQPESVLVEAASCRRKVALHLRPAMLSIDGTFGLAHDLRSRRDMTIPIDPVVGVDVGASTISAGLVSPDGTVLATVQAPTLGPDGVIDTIFALVDRALALARDRGQPVAGIGIGLPGVVDVENGHMRSVPGNWLPELGDVPLAALVRERTGIAVCVDNDVNALTLAEWFFGHGRGASSLLTIAIGTGIGGGLIVDGTLLHGHLGGTGEIGHLSVSLTGPACVCGGVGCLATYVAGNLIPDRAREWLGRYRDSAVLSRAGGDPARISAAVVFEAAAGGDPLARTVVDEACEALASAVVSVVNLLNPEVIVITGGVAASLAPLRDDILRRARRRALTVLFDATTIQVVPVDKRDTVRGGAALVLYQMARA
jgi:glucokinase